MNDIALSILRYLADNPEAGDTAEGIAEWWLPVGDARPGRSNLEQALSELTAGGWLVVSRGADARRRYRLAPSQMDAVAAFRRREGGA
jgi:hypothetical protein